MESTTTKTKFKTNYNINKSDKKISRIKSFGGSCNNLFSCCKPVDTAALTTTTTTYHGGSGNEKPVLKHNIAMGEKGFPPIHQVLTDDNKDNFTKKIKESHRKLARIMKAVFCETALAKKMRGNKLRPKMYQQDSKGSRKSEKNLRPLSRVSSNPSLLSEESYHKTLPKSCSSSTFYSTSSRLSGSLSSMIPPSVLKKSNPILSMSSGKKCYGYDTALGMILISLLILVIWGKSCAMFWTVTWLIFVPRLSNIANNSASDEAKSEFEINSLENSMKRMDDH